MELNIPFLFVLRKGPMFLSTKIEKRMLTLFLLILSTTSYEFVCAKSHKEKKTRISADYIIVGGGTAGAALAAKLSDRVQ